MRSRRLVHAVGIVVLVAIVVPFFVYAFPQIIGAEQSFVVVSGSMAPAIGAGDVVVVGDSDPATIREGDVITFVRAEEEAPTTHRVVDIHQRDDRLAFETKGDANENVDPELVPESNVIGAVVLTIPYIGYVIQFVNTPVGFLLLLGLPLGLLVVAEVWSLANAATRSTVPATDSRTPENGADTEAESDGTADEPSQSAESPTPETQDSASSSGDGEDGRESDDDETSAVSIHPSDLTVTLCLLVVAAPYTVYVVLQVRTALTLSVMFGSIFSLFAIGGLWLAERSSAADTAERQPGQTTDGEGTVDGSADGGVR
jgi:signal peptidase